MDDLVEAARGAAERSYAPYSGYRVGAALLASDGSVYTGCNVENANYSNTLHAEELAVGRAVLDGRRELERIAISSSRRDGVTPCGTCRQTLIELCDADLVVTCDEGDTVTEYTLDALLPATTSTESVARD